MCQSGPPYGIPIPKEVHMLFPDNVKQAYEVFDSWLKGCDRDAPLKKADMPAEVRTAMETILAAPIPGMEDHTAAESCYMVTVLDNLED